MDSRQKFVTQLKDHALKVNARNIFSLKEYEKTLTDYQMAKENTKSKSGHQYRLLKRFSVIEVDGVRKLTLNKDNSDSIQYIVPVEHMFDKLLELHLATGHGCRDRMEREVNNKYAFITRKAIEIFLGLCETCQLKRKQAKKGLVVKPIVSKEFNSRCQVDLVDMQSQPDGDKKYIMVYQDHLTKFVQIRALKTKTAEEVSRKLKKIFAIFGAPHILQR